MIKALDKTIKISKHQFNDSIIDNITYEDYHEAIEGACSIYKFNNLDYIVICINSLREDDGSFSYLVFNYYGAFSRLILVKNKNIIINVLQQFQKDNF